MIAQCPNNRIRVLTPSGIRISQPFITDVEDHRMKTAVEPAEKCIQLAVFRPHRRHTIPAIQLLLKDLAADLAQMLKRLVLGFPLRQEVNIVGSRLRSSNVSCALVGSTRCSQSRNGCAGLTTIAERLTMSIAVTQAAAR